MSYFKSIIFFVCIIIMQSCKETSTYDVSQWTKSIKQKIIEDAYQEADKEVFDSAKGNLTYYKNGRKLRFFHIMKTYDVVSITDPNPKLTSIDTSVAVYYSTDQKFELVKELFPTFEGIKYEGEYFGVVEFKDAISKTMQTGYRYKNEDVGTWITYDTTGKFIREKDNGNAYLLNKIKDITYYR